MHYKHFHFFIGLIILALSCTEDSKTTFKNTNITAEKNELVEINIPEAIENNQISKKINKEIHKIVIAALQIGEEDVTSSKTIKESIIAFNDEYTDFYSDFPNVSQPWDAQIDGEVMHQTPQIISVAITSYVNTGGAHGNTRISFLNFDTATGNRIQNDALINNKKAFETVAKTYLMDAVDADDLLSKPNHFKLPENIGFNNEGVILLYNQYEIAPYSTGIIDFTIPIEKVRDFLSFNGTY